MALTQRRPDRAGREDALTATVAPQSDWSWERTLPITPAARPQPGPGLRFIPGPTWWTAGVITLMFVVLVIIV